MPNVDVQLYPGSVYLRFGTDTGQISHADFDDLASQCAEAALAKRGRESHNVVSQEVSVGDFMLGREVVNVRLNRPASGMTTINLAPFGFLLLNMGEFVKVERPIQ